MFSNTYVVDLPVDDTYGYAMGTQSGLLLVCCLGDSARKNLTGVRQADAYSGFNDLFVDGRLPGPDRRGRMQGHAT
jgi:hypothetical protein